MKTGRTYCRTGVTIFFFPEMEGTEKKEEKEKKEDKKKKKEEKKEEAVLPPPSVFSLVLLFLRVLTILFVFSVVLVWFTGFKELDKTYSPTSLPSRITQHLQKGTMVPLFVQDTKLSVFSRSEGFVTHSEETVLLISLESSLVFEDTQLLLAKEGISSVAVDLPGFGLSDKPEGMSYSESFLCESVKEFLTSSHLDSIHLFVEGRACAVGELLVVKYPHLVSSYMYHDCKDKPRSAPMLHAFAMANSPLLPAIVGRSLFSGFYQEKEEDRFLVLYKSGHRSHFKYLESEPSTENRDITEFCLSKECGMLRERKDISMIVTSLPDRLKQKKQARETKKPVYVDTSGTNKYGMHEHGDHDHGGHDHGGHDHAHSHH